MFDNFRRGGRGLALGAGARRAWHVFLGLCVVDILFGLLVAARLWDADAPAVAAVRLGLGVAWLVSLIVLIVLWLRDQVRARDDRPRR